MRPGQEDAPPVGRDDQAGHGRIAVADGDDEVVDLAQRVAVGVEHGSADGLAQVEHGCHLACGTSRRRWRDHGGPRSAVRRRDGPVSRCRRHVCRRWDWDRRPRGCVSLGSRLWTAAAHEGPRRSRSVDPALSDGQRPDRPVRWSSPDPVPMAPPHGDPAMRPSVRAREDRETTGSRLPGKGRRRLPAAPPRPRPAQQSTGRPRLDPPAFRRRRASRPSRPSRRGRRRRCGHAPVEAELAESLDTVLRHRRPAGRLPRPGRAGPAHRRRDEARAPGRRHRPPLRARRSARARRPGPDCPTRLVRDMTAARPRRRASSATSCVPDTSWPGRTSTPVGHAAGEQLPGSARLHRPPRRPARPRRRVIGVLSAVTRADAGVDERRGRLHGHARDPCRDRPDQCRAARGDRHPGRPAGGPPVRLGADERGDDASPRSARRSSTRRRRIIDYHNARVYVVEPPDDIIPIAFKRAGPGPTTTST